MSKTFAPSGRLFSPQEIAWAAVYFLSAEAMLINGSILDVEQFPVIGRNPGQGKLGYLSMKPKLSAFPKCYMDELCIQHSMSVFEWIELAATLSVDGLEFYSGFLHEDQTFLNEVRQALGQHRLTMPMLCCSSLDFTQPDPLLLQEEIERGKADD